MSRLVLTPRLVLKGTDSATRFEVRYNSEYRLLEIGCQANTLDVWKRDGEEIIGRQLGGGCGVLECSICEPDRKYAVRQYLPRLKRLIAHIERAEAALKKGLRSQTKRA